MNCRVRRIFQDIDEDLSEMPRDISDLLHGDVVAAINSCRPQQAPMNLLVTGPGRGTMAFLLIDGDPFTSLIVPDAQDREDVIVKRTQFDNQPQVVGSSADVRAGTKRVYVRLPSRRNSPGKPYWKAFQARLPESVEEVVVVLAVRPHWQLTIPDGFTKAIHLKAMSRSDRERLLKYTFIDAGIEGERRVDIPFPATWHSKSSADA